MSSPKIEVVFIYDSNGNPVTGVVPTFSSYTDESGIAISPQPVISEIGGGAYKFTPVFTDTSKGIVYILNCGASLPKYYARYIRNTDWDIDNVTPILQYSTGKWAIQTSGPDINKLIIYAPDGVTVLYKYTLLDKNGIPTSTNPYSRNPS